MMKNNRIIKNTVMIALVVVLACSSFLTFKFIGDSPGGRHNLPQMTMDGNGPPNMNGGDSSNDSQNDSQSGWQPDNDDNSSGNQSGQPPQMNGNSDSDNNSSDNNNNSGNNNQQGTPPDMPNNNNSSNGSSSGNSDNNQQETPPAMPGGNNNDNSGNNQQNGQPPQMNGNNGSNNQGGPPQMGGQDNQNGFRPDFASRDSNDILKYSLFAVESLMISMIIVYLIMSRFNKKGFRQTLHGMSNIVIYILVTLIAAAALTGAQVAATKIFNDVSTSQSQSLPDFTNKGQDSKSNQNGQNGQNNQNGQGNMPGGNNSSSDVDASGATTVEAEKTLSKSYSSTESDESAILVQNGGNAKISGATVEKSGDSTNTENSEFYGINAGILVKEGSAATIKNATIKTSAKGANAVFSTGEKSKIYISDSTITTTGESSARGLDATYGGYIEADNVTITTKGGSCATLATDRGEGTVKVTNSKLTTNGAGSPVIYSTGDISVKNTTGTANGAQIAVIEGKNSATITSSKMTCSATGNRGDVDRAGVMIYQSMSGDASEGKGTFNATDSTLTINKNSAKYKTAPMFFVTNTDAEINLKNTKLSFGSGVLLDAEGTSEWGNSGSNGGNVTLNATNQTLTGDIKIDKISTLDMNLKSSTYKGTINGGNTAKSVKLTLDKNSKITLTGDSYVTELSNADSTNSNIDFNGYKLYVNGKAVN